MRQELSRATKELAKAENPPYFIGYSVYDQDLVIIVGSYGSLLTSASAHRREADVTMRVGSPALDNTHGDNRQSGMTSGRPPWMANPKPTAASPGSVQTLNTNDPRPPILTMSR